MRIFLVLVCSLALATVALGAETEKKEERKRKAAHAEEAAKRERNQREEAARRERERRRGHPAEVDKRTKAARTIPLAESKPKPLRPERFKPTPFKPQHLVLPNKPSRLIPPVRFSPTRRIEGSERWVGRNYEAFRLYRPAWHDRFWWRNHYNRVVLIGGGAYYWNAGFWYPAWGYDPGYAYYPYDGPIYAYNNLPPDQVIGNVQTALQQQGYYQGAVDGLLGPLTRAAIANYQRNNGLTITSAIDQPTLQSLGMS
jgi:hypothetical protein